VIAIVYQVYSKKGPSSNTNVAEDFNKYAKLAEDFHK
jgi:hypothetical protein